MKRLIQLLFLFLALSCQREEGGVSNSDLHMATVSLSLELTGDFHGTPDSKAIDDPVSVASTEIRNICILQYRGTDEDAVMVGDVRYLSVEADPSDEEHYLDFNKIRLVDSQGSNHTLVILVNTFTQLPQVETLGEMKNLWRQIESQTDVFGHAGDGSGFPTDETYYQRMGAFAVTSVTNGTIIRAKLRRSMARIQVAIVNDGTDGLQISQVWLRNVSQKDYYLVDYTYIDPSDGTTEQILFPGEFQDEYDPTWPLRMDYPVQGWTGDMDGTGTANYLWYVPANMRGTDPSGNDLESEKGRCPNADGATYLWILGYYGASHDKAILFKYYLGENLTNNFDLKPNTSYSFTITMHGKGSAATDDRTDDLSRIDYDVDANCYIINPPPEGSRIYSFNAVHRPNLFWGSPTADRYGVYASGLYPNRYISSSDTWYARIVWSDFSMTPEEANAFLSHKTGTGAGSYTDFNQRIQVTVPSSITYGNVIIGVYKDNPDEFLWSWHLWITDYQPDDILGHSPENDRFVYPVTGGEVHRYAGALWRAGGRYENGYAMDRNLGALDDRYHGSSSRGGSFYYQFGRKDPFPANNTIYTYTYDGIRSTSAITFLNRDEGDLAGTNLNNMPYSVSHPLTFIKAPTNYWTYNDIFNPLVPGGIDIMWQDSKNRERVDNEEVGANADKPFFDPCPSGWRIPWATTNSQSDTWWQGFVGDGDGSSTANPEVNFQKGVDATYGRNRGDGVTYFPHGFLAEKDNPHAQTIFFPFTGSRAEGGGGITYQNSTLHLWTVLNWNHDVNRGIPVGYTSPVYVTGHAPRYFGYAIRCVREDY